MKVALVGGHLTPALAVLDGLDKETEVIFIGRKHSIEGETVTSLEYNVITNKGIPFYPLTTGRLQRKITVSFFTSLLKIPYGLIQALSILVKSKPDIIVAFGGYLSVPVGIAAYLLRIPVLIHEQTLAVGLANKILAPIAKVICISWKQSQKYFPENKTVLTGNPVRKFTKSDSSFNLHKGEYPLIYVTGGSTGAHAINDLIEGCLEKLLYKYKVIHQTGDTVKYKDYERLVSFKKKLPTKLAERYQVTKQVKPYEVGTIMDACDLVVSRSGINTVTELLLFGKPCLLIPLPYGQKSDQLINASFVKKVGIGEFIKQSELDSKKLNSIIDFMFENISKYKVHSDNAKRLVRVDATQNIIKQIYEILSQKKK